MTVIVYLVVLFLGFFTVAFVVRLFRRRFYALAERSLALVNVLLLKIEEDEKVKLVQQNNNRLIIALGQVVLSVVVALFAASVPFVVYLFFQDQTFQDLDFSSISSIITLTVGSTLGFVVPVKKKGSETYSELSQLLHRMALNNYAIAYKLFRQEAKRLPKKGISEQEKFVIVSGLARAGTTSLMNKLTKTELLASLSYANMPFLTAPNLWSKIYKPKSGEKKERSHKDGIMIGQDSTEALEEYFFKVLANDAYILEEALVEYRLTEEQYSDYLKYQGVVRNDEQKIYLAKNNNFLLRYDSIRQLNKDFLVIFMFRDPLTHAASLLEKHIEFTAMQKDDGFVLEYMNWLGHHEFGLNQKPFQFSDNSPDYIEDKGALDYWLQIWINYYSNLLSVDRTGVIFVDYDYYCQQPMDLLDRLYQRIGVSVDVPQVSPYFNKRVVDYEYSEELELKANEIYAKLKALV